MWRKVNAVDLVMAARRVVGEVGMQDSEKRQTACLTMKKKSKLAPGDMRALSDMQGASISMAANVDVSGEIGINRLEN